MYRQEIKQLTRTKQQTQRGGDRRKGHDFGMFVINMPSSRRYKFECENSAQHRVRFRQFLIGTADCEG